MWTSDDAEKFASRAPDLLFRLYRKKEVKQLLVMFAELIFRPLEMLFSRAAEDSLIFDDRSREALLRLWLPMLLRFELEGELLQKAFQPACVEAIFNSLAPSSKDNF